jgi:hypothetical protein
MNKVRLVILFTILNVFALILHLWIMGSTFTISSLSDVYFVVGIITFLPSIVAMTKAYVVFQGFSYAMKSMFGKNFKSMYPQFKDYQATKEDDIKTTFFTELLISSFSVMLIGIVLAVMV